MRARSAPAFVLLPALLCAGCIEPFDGSRLTFNLSPSTRPPCQVATALKLALSTQKCAGNERQDRTRLHYEVWATVRRSAVVYLASFTVQRHLFIDEQQQFERDGKLLAAGTPFRIGREQKLADMAANDRTRALAQLASASKPLAITSYSSALFEKDGKTFRPALYVGSHSQLTRPHNGTYFGQVEGQHPFGAATLGGASLNVGPSLSELDTIFVTIEEREPPTGDGVTTSPARPSPWVYLKGTAKRTARGVINVDATNPNGLGVTATFVVHTALEQESYF